MHHGRIVACCVGHGWRQGSPIFSYTKELVAPVASLRETTHLVSQEVRHHGSLITCLDRVWSRPGGVNVGCPEHAVCARRPAVRCVFRVPTTDIPNGTCAQRGATPSTTCSALHGHCVPDSTLATGFPACPEVGASRPALSTSRDCVRGAPCADVQRVGPFDGSCPVTAPILQHTAAPYHEGAASHLYCHAVRRERGA